MKRKFTYSLLLIALMVWGIIFYRIFFLKAEPENLFIDTIERVTPMKTVTIPYELITDYQDPFFEKKVIKEIQVSIPTHASETNPLVVEEEIAMPVLKYIGLIQNPSTQKQITLINFEGKDYMLGKGDIQNGIKLLEITDDYIKVHYQGSTKLIYK